MKRPLFFLALIFITLLILAPIIIYVSNFRTGQFSTNNQDWGNFGNYINGTLSPVIALLGTALTLLIWFISHEHNKTIIEKQEMEKRPLANIGYSDFEEKLEINLWNKGLGPLIVTKFSVINRTNGIVKDSIYDWISDLGITLSNYSGNQDNLVLREGTKINLLRLEQAKNDNEFSERRDSLRRVLKDLDIQIEYDDIYNKKMKTYRRSLKWFGRHFENQ